MNKRSGSEKDAEALIVILDKLGFNVQAHMDLTIKKTRALLNSSKYILFGLIGRDKIKSLFPTFFGMKYSLAIENIQHY